MYPKVLTPLQIWVYLLFKKHTGNQSINQSINQSKTLFHFELQKDSMKLMLISLKEKQNK